jgi:hypothetical protein
MGTSKGGAFDIAANFASGLLRNPTPHGLPNSNVVVPWVNGKDITGRSRDMWIIDYGVGMNEQSASLYDAPFEYLIAHVKPERDRNARESYRRLWWHHVEARPDHAPEPVGRELLSLWLAGRDGESSIGP